MTTPANPAYDPSQWESYLDLVKGITQGLAYIPARDMLREIAEMETLAPIMEPTAYINGGADNLRDQAELLRAVLGLQEAIEAIVTRNLGAKRIA
jgi:hypothetical protein